MSKHQFLNAIAPLATVAFAFFGMWCGHKRRLTLLALACMGWLLFSTWMMR